MDLLKFQTRFLAAALAPDVDTAALSLARGNGKTHLAGFILANRLAETDGTECVLLAGSLSQARLTFRVVRGLLGEVEWKWADSATLCGARHPKTGTRLRVISSNARTALGLVGVPLVVGDEPGSWEVAGGALMFDALATAQGKPDSPLRVVLIGTRAPAASGWWIDLLDGGSGGSTHVTDLHCEDMARWDSWATIKRCNPLMWRFPASRKKLFEERDKARRSPAAKARFCSYRLNVPSRDSREVILSPDQWDAVTSRTPAGPDGRRPVCGVDLGESRAWSAAVAVWPSGYVESCAITNGATSLADQERADRVPSGTYAKLAEAGVLIQDEGRQVPRVEKLVELIRRWRPRGIICDRFKAASLVDARPGCEVSPRLTRWSECTSDLESTRRLALDGGMSIDPASASLLGVSMAVSTVVSDDQGNQRIEKGKNNTARDDVVAALVLAAGGLDRLTRRSSPYEIRLVRPA